MTSCTWSVCFHLLYGTAQKDAVIESLNTQLVSKPRTLQQYSMGEIQNFGSSMERLDKAA